MKEEFLYYLWENRLLAPDMHTVDGEELTVVSVGMRNYDSGPDYLNSRIKMLNIFIEPYSFDL